ncbi:MAG: hypothetical protein WC523_06135 [Patescibacteria group bacterium]|jgi:hypothetical protein
MKKIKKNKKNDQNKKQFLSGGAVVLLSLLFLFLGLKMFFNNLEKIMIKPAANKTAVGTLFSEAKNNSGVRPEIQANTVQENLPSVQTDQTPVKKARQLTKIETDKEKYFVIPGVHQDLDETSFLASPDAQNFAYVLRQNNLESISLNGRAATAYDKITFMRFSPDSKHFAYGVKTNGQEMVVLDGEPGKAYDFIFGPYFFSPDSQYFIYKARTGQGDVVVLNTQESRIYDQIYDPFLTTDKEQLVYFGLVGSILWRTEIDLQPFE